ncbi:DUF4041 domain-containing protein [Clostridium botulinum]|uniref:DUF4041 domain-containing protein n=1 Tax=Clostridium botulinum TaxID=1491 RepID=UPI0004B701D4|nr:DUF4041 domain-containing protein [Clostridium botulinum]APQ71806.1 hypothetical protein RSJ9_2735 [Clostridium botulinum]
MKKPFYTEEGLLLMLAILSIFFQPLSILCVIIIIMKIHYNKKMEKQLEETTNNKIKDAQNKLNELDNKILDKQAEDNSLNLKLETIQSKLKDTNMIINKKEDKIKQYEEQFNIMKNFKSYKDLEKELTTYEVGVFKKQYDFEISEEYSVKLKEIQKKQADYIKNGNAIIINLSEFIETLELNKSTRNKFVNSISKLVLRAFNNECDAALSKINSNNITNIRNRIESSFNQINKLSSLFAVSIHSDYLKLKIEELQLAFEYEVKKQEEKEEQKALKEHMREEAKVLKEIEIAKKKIEKEETHFTNALADVKNKLKNANDTEKENLLKKLEELENKIKEIEENKKDILNREQNTRAGYVYIISNIGSFGENVYKIGMTRRLNPIERISELSSASVPFSFDVHAMIFSEDAPTLENSLHKIFEKYSVNKINLRKEFFRLPLDKIEHEVKKNHNAVVKFTKLAKAEEYRQTLKLEQSEEVESA